MLISAQMMNNSHVCRNVSIKITEIIQGDYVNANNQRIRDHL